MKMYTITEPFKKYAQDVFDHYNGIINTFNYPAVLHFDDYNNSIGCAGFPNIVYINPKRFIDTIIENIKTKVDDNDINLVSGMVEMVIIHELFHLDQLKTYNNTLIPLPEKEIEAQVNYKTIKYIKNNPEIIRTPISEKVLNNHIKIYKQEGWFESLYIRKTTIDHIIEFFLGIASMLDELSLNQIKDLLTNSNKVGILIKHYKYYNLIRESKLHIKNNDFIIPVNEFNDFIEHMYFAQEKTSIDVYHNTCIHEDDDETMDLIVIEINIRED